MLELSELSVDVGRRRVLDALSLRVAAGEVLGVIGPNGAGKTTLLRVLTGELAPKHGTLRLGARALSDLPVLELARQRAYLSQHPVLSFEFSVLEVVMLGRAPHRARESQGMALDVVQRAMDLVSVSSLAERPYLELSGGERQRVQLARVLAQIWHPVPQGARLLLLDEPTSSLDLRHQHATLAAVRQFAAGGVAVVVVLHDLTLAAQYTDRCLLLCAGRTLATGPTREVLRLDHVSRAFGVTGHSVTVPETGLSLIVTSGALPPRERQGEDPAC